MNNSDRSIELRGKVDAFMVVYGHKDQYIPKERLNAYGEQLSVEERLAFAYIDDVTDLCDIVDGFPDKTSEIEAAHAEVEFWKKLSCPCECVKPAPYVNILGNVECDTCNFQYIRTVNKADD